MTGIPGPSRAAHRTNVRFSLTPRDTPILSGIWDPSWGLSKKIRKACEVARRDGYQYIWIDSSCINKASSTELSEAINSMHNWYCGAHVCYAFLSDVPFDDDVSARDSRFRRSRWFTRGWTLQELIAPRFVIFLSEDWKRKGMKDTLVDVIRDITRIDRDILLHEKPLRDASVAQRMSWAADRETTRVEDRAYCLLGIFGISMPTLYGEGKQAFRRLQEEILRRIPDQSLFAWGSTYMLQNALRFDHASFQGPIIPGGSKSLFALSPASFANTVVRASHQTFTDFHLPPLEYSTTPYGIRTKLLLIPCRPIRVHGENAEGYFAILGCSSLDAGPQKLLARACYIPTAESQPNCLYPGMVEIEGDLFDTLTLSLEDLNFGSHACTQIKTVYLPHLDQVDVSPKQVAINWRSVDTLTLTLSEQSRAALLRQQPGYAVSNFQRPSEYHPNTHSFTLSSDSFAVHIKYLHTICESHEVVLVTARIWVLSLDEDADQVDDAVPYAATTWIIHRSLSPMTSPMARNLALVSPSGDEVTLELSFDLVARSLYDIHVAITSAPPDPPEAMTAEHHKPRMPHGSIEMILRGSVRNALRAKGYAVHFAQSQDDPNTHTLILSHTDFIITIPYSHRNFELNRDLQSSELLFVASVTLEANSCAGASHAYRDGPFTLVWTDWCTPAKGWEWRLDHGQLALIGPSREPLTLRLGLELAFESEYYLHVDVLPERGSFHHPKPPKHTSQNPLSLGLKGLAHLGGVMLTLRGRTRRALEALGYTVRFRENPFGVQSLKLSSPSFAIIIQYSHVVEEDGTGLTLLADVKTCGPSDDPPGCGALYARDRGSLPSHQWPIVWNVARTHSRTLGVHETILAPQPGVELTLRLGFRMVWYSKYRLIVEMDNRSPRTQSLDVDDFSSYKS